MRQAKVCECGRRLDDPDLRLLDGQLAEIAAPCTCDEPGSKIVRVLWQAERDRREQGLRSLLMRAAAEAKGGA